MAQCPKCGTQSDGLFCPSCGAQVTPPQAQQAAASQPSYNPAPPPQYQPPTPPVYNQPAQSGPFGQPQQPPQPGPYGPAPQYPPQAPQPGPYGQAPQPGPYGQAPQPGPYGPAPYPYQQPKKGGAGKVILIIVGVIVALFLGLIVLGALVSDDEGGGPTPSSSTSDVLGVTDGPVITTEIDTDTQEPLTDSMSSVPTSSGLIYATVEVSGKQGQVVNAVWFYNGKHQEHLDTEMKLPADYKGWLSFSIDNGGDPWPTGEVVVEIHIDGNYVTEASFELE